MRGDPEPPVTRDGMNRPLMTQPDPNIPYAPVAIIMRTKERPLLLRRALGDVIRQSYPGGSRCSTTRSP